jgi:hypothetical protein
MSLNIEKMSSTCIERKSWPGVAAEGPRGRGGRRACRLLGVAEDLVRLGARLELALRLGRCPDCGRGCHFIARRRYDALDLVAATRSSRRQGSRSSSVSAAMGLRPSPRGLSATGRAPARVARAREPSRGPRL